MGVEVAGTCFHWSQPLLPPSPTSSQAIASVFSSLSYRRRGIDHALTHHILHQTEHRSPFLGAASGRLSRTRSLEIQIRGGRRSGREQSLRRAISASLADDDDEEEFVSRLQELAMRLHRESSNDSDGVLPDSRIREQAESTDRGQDAPPFSPSSAPPSKRTKGHDPASEPPWPAIRLDPPEWPDLVPASVERKANSVELPLSLRMIKRRKKRWEEGFREAGEIACCSVSKAFSSMVFIVRELQSYTLQMRELLFVENLQGVLARVQGELHASFVWLFQHIFSCTPTLMLSLMILLANFSVYSMGHTAFAASPGPSYHSVVTVAENHHQPRQQQQQMFDPSSIKTFSDGGRTASVGGSGDGGGGGKVRPVAGATDDGRSDGYSHGCTIIPEGVSTLPEGAEGAATVTTEEEEARVWNRIVEEASGMQAAWKDEALMDPETLQRFVSPVTVEVEPEEQSTFLQTELMYHRALSQDPDNALLLSNFAQFLYLVLHDHDRAEYYFKRAVQTEPADAESLSRYASFLWVARKDLGAAEETYLEAIAADPGNTFYAANYAHFLWNTGGEDTCYPLDGDDGDV